MISSETVEKHLRIHQTINRFITLADLVWHRGFWDNWSGAENPSQCIKFHTSPLLYLKIWSFLDLQNWISERGLASCGFLLSNSVEPLRKRVAQITSSCDSNHFHSCVCVAQGTILYKWNVNVVNDSDKEIKNWLMLKSYILLPLEMSIKGISASHFSSRRNNCACVRLTERKEGWRSSPLSTVRWSVPWVWHRGLTCSACLGPTELCRTRAALLWRRR